MENTISSALTMISSVEVLPLSMPCQEFLLFVFLMTDILTKLT